MSVCCAVLVDGGCWVGCDSQYTRGSVYYFGSRKAEEVNGVTVLHSGAAPVGAAVREALCKAFGDVGPRAVLVGEFAEALVEACARRGWAGEAEDGEPVSRDLCLIATDGHRLFEFDNYLFAREVTAGQFCAIGQHQHAHGAAFAVRRCRVPPSAAMVEIAIEAAAAHCIFVGGEVHVWFVPESSEWRLA
jgi:hypothetical protein